MFIPVGEGDEEFLRSILDDGIVHISYIRMSNRRIEKVAGPLAGYRNHIAKLDIPHRRAIVEDEIFGKKRKVRFGLWTDQDPENAWLSRRMGIAAGLPVDGSTEIDIGLAPGDVVKDDTGIYGDYEFVIDRVDAKHRIVHTTFAMGASLAKIQLDADKVSRTGEQRKKQDA